MGIQDLQTFLEGTRVPGSSVPVDLLRIARGIAQRQNKQHRGKTGQHVPNKLSLVVDGECCLDRLYGGYFSDWACGGQWNRMVQFLAVLIQTVQTSNIDLAVFFNGCLEQQRMNEWIVNQQRTRLKINQVLKHINTKGTPPPKIWWTAPVCLRTCLRMALRHLNVSVLCTMDDHHQEVIAYCRENCFHGLVADDGEYAVFDPPRYFSSEHLKLTYKGSLETKEYILAEVAKGLSLTSDRFCVLAALLGNYLLSEQDLSDFYRKLNITQPPGKIPVDVLVKTVAGFVEGLQAIDNLDVVAIQVFGSSSDSRASKLKQSVQYYLNGTKDGFLRYRPQPSIRRTETNRHVSQKSSTSMITTVMNSNGNGKPMDMLDTSKFASETDESERDSLALYKEATSKAKSTPQIVIEPPTSGQVEVKDTRNDLSVHINDGSDEASGSPEIHAINGNSHTANLLLSSSSSSSSSSATSPSRLTPDQASKNKTQDDLSPGNKKIVLPTISPEVMRTASERHQKGLMSPLIYQILTQGEIKLPVLMEDESHKELPSIHLFYRPVRQMVYAILFNLHHQIYMASKGKEKNEIDKTELPEVYVKEWVWSKNNQYQAADYVKAEEIGWGVPTIQRLWFGSAIDDKRRRLRAFLTCMHSDTPLMLNPAYVPQHLLVMASVLRYIMSFPEKTVLRKPELDAFIAQAFSPELMNAYYLQELQLPLVTSRGVQLATLFMQGVETALLANDACGAPIPWLMCCPWLFFDGKLFHHKLARTSVVKNLLELCDHHIDHVVKVERMRQAILEGLNVQFSRLPLPQMSGVRLPGMPPSNVLPAGSPLVSPRALPIGRRGGVYPSSGPSRGIVRPAVPARGGQLEIAGVVVGSWGANFGSRGVNTASPHSGPVAGHSRGVRIVEPQVTSVGGLKTSFRSGNAMPGYNLGNVTPGRPTFSTRGKLGSLGRGKKTQIGGPKKKPGLGKKIVQRDGDRRESKGRGMTVESPGCGETMAASALLNDISASGNGLNAQCNPDVVPGQFDDAHTAAIVTNNSVDFTSQKPNMTDGPLSIIDGIGHKGQGDGPSASVLPSVLMADN